MSGKVEVPNMLVVEHLQAKVGEKDERQNMSTRSGSELLEALPALT